MDRLEDDRTADFVQLLTGAQSELFTYICLLISGTHEASNVLQETNLTLWKKMSQYQPGTNFAAWAREVAYFKALAYVRDKKRSRLVLDQQAVERAFVYAAKVDTDDRQLALRHCMSALSEANLHLLRLRYQGEVPLTEIATRMQKSEGAVKMALHRLRVSLLGCINERLGVNCG
jgi:RNA polymerase sigma-70 factor (ECF subfamily)